MGLAISSKSSRTAGRDLSAASGDMRVCDRFRDGLASLGLTSLDAVFAFDSGRDLAKANIGRFRRRLQFDLAPAGDSHPVRLFLKRYDRPPRLAQLRNWLSHHGRKSFGRMEQETADDLASAGVATPHVVACGEQWGVLFERRSFLISEEVKDSRSLESRLPACFEGPLTPEKQRARRAFISRLALFIRQFHQTGYRHRDLYLSHIFCSDSGQFCLIDLARASRPFLRERFRVKDVAQLHYSAPAQAFTRADRLRFYLAYADQRRLRPRDKTFIRKVLSKTGRMADHNLKRGNAVPFLGRQKADHP